MMRYRFVFTAWFDRDLKSLRKHNPDLRSDFESFLQTLDAKAHPLIPNTSGARKARMKAKRRGKRGGYRVVYYTFTTPPARQNATAAMPCASTAKSGGFCRV
ncbi:MAG: hypothetical protein Q7U34_13215 [Anaerolineales bacterium]|nr:hypothetical protein [Anaerolineales bacterium]